MAKDQILQIKQMDMKALKFEKEKLSAQLISTKAELSQTGKKNSNQTKKIKKQIARIETILSEKIISEYLKEENGQK